MTKTPDEIKNGLDNPIHVHYHISDIEPRLTPLALHDLEFLHEDALALIQQLQAENAEKDERIQQLEAERDAAMAGLKSNCTCPERKYFSDDIQDPCRGCKPTDSKFEWRGVQKEE